MMDDVIWWFGAIHIAAYALAAFLVALWAFIEWLLKRLDLKVKLIRALAEYYKRRSGFIGAGPHPQEKPNDR